MRGRVVLDLVNMYMVLLLVYGVGERVCLCVG